MLDRTHVKLRLNLVQLLQIKVKPASVKQKYIIQHNEAQMSK